MTQRVQLICILFVTFAFCGCHENRLSTDDNLKLSDYDNIRDKDLVLDAKKIHNGIANCYTLDKDTTRAGHYLRRYYADGGKIVWFTKMGVNNQVDTLLSCLRTVTEMGFQQKHFMVDEIAADLAKLRKMDVGDENLNTVVSRFEYNTTKAYLRYVSGQHFGFTNPNYIFNHLDIDEHDENQGFRQNSDLPIEQPNDAFFKKVMEMVEHDSVANVLADAKPKNPLYEKYLSKLAEAKTDADRRLILINMEKARWRYPDYPQSQSRYVFVNIPAYHVWAVDGDKIIDMKVVTGARSTKTPLLCSRVKRLDVNPQWVIPTSIIKHELVNHAGDSAYFASRHYIIRDRATGEEVDPTQSSADLFSNASYTVVQEGGPGNALGRLIFRFDNKFSVYMHDTPTRSAFGRADRSESHGCIRLERPFDMAKFLLPNKDDDFFERLDKSINATEKEDMVISNVAISPEVPLYIGYYTLFLDPNGEWHTYSDVYGYDECLQRVLKNYEK